MPQSQLLGYERVSVEADVVVFENCTGTTNFENNISTTRRPYRKYH
ncbi:hypothetical protein [Campylobacter concisus]|nr:hypothetical protein [Campylobacter concisus]